VLHSLRHCSRGKALKASRFSRVAHRAAATSGNCPSSMAVTRSNCSATAVASGWRTRCARCGRPHLRAHLDRLPLCGRGARRLQQTDRRLVPWPTTSATELVLDALEMALWHRQPEAGVVHHSDRAIHEPGLGPAMPQGRHHPVRRARWATASTTRWPRAFPHPRVRAARPPAHVPQPHRRQARSVRLHRGLGPTPPARTRPSATSAPLASSPTCRPPDRHRATQPVRQAASTPLARFKDLRCCRGSWEVQRWR
jgi:hypothetical protein